MSEPTRIRAGWPAIVVALAAIVCLPTLGTRGLIDADDSILRLPLVSGAQNIPKIFGGDFMAFTGGRYEPLPYAVLAAARTFVRPESVLIWHAGLVALCLVNALLVYGVARHFAKGPAAPLLALAVAALHPAVAAFANQVNLFPSLLAGTLYLGTFLSYLRWARTGRGLFYWSGIALFAGGLFTSSVFMTLPLLILVSEFFYERTALLRGPKRVIPFTVVILAAACCRLTLHPHPAFFVPAPTALPDAGRYWLFSFAAGGVDSAWGLLRGMCGPVPVSDLFRTAAAQWSALVAIALVLLASVWMLRRGWWLAVGAFLLWAAMLPQSGAPERLTPDLESWSCAWLPLAGLALAAGALVDLLRPLRILSVALACVVAATCAGLLAMTNLEARSPESWFRLMVRQSPRSASASVALGKTCLDAGNEKEAMEHFFAPQVDRVREACLLLARHYARKGDFGAAAVHLRIALREEGSGLMFQDDVPVLAEVLEEAGAWDYAEQELGTVLMADPNNASALRRLAHILAGKGFVPAAREVLARASRIDPRDPETLRVASELAEIEGGRGPVRVTPPDIEWLRSVIDQGGGWYTREAAKLADTHPDDPILQLVAGISLAEVRDFDAADLRLDRAMKMLPLYSRPRAAKCWVAASRDNRDLAMRVVDETTHLKPWDAGVWHQLGYNVWQQGDARLALACLGKAVEADPNRADLQNDAGALSALNGLFDESLPHARRALALPGGDRAAMHNLAAIDLRSAGKTREAEEHLLRALELDPWYVPAYRALADLRSEEGRFRDAAVVLSRGLKKVPGDPLLSFVLASVLATAPDAGVRDGARAVVLAEEARRKAKPLTAPHLDLLAAAYAENGRFDDAVATARQAADLARSHGNEPLARSIELRRQLYESRRPYHLPPPPSR